MKFLCFLVSIGFLNMAFGQIPLNITGLTKTKKSVINNEIKDIIQKKVLEEFDLVEIERRLWNLRLFSKIKLTKTKENLTIHLNERWTTIPIAKASSGGGTSYYALGVYDINTFGSNTEFGVQYESLNNQPAGVIWLRKPQYLKNRNLSIGIDLWSINRVRSLYDSTSSEELGAFTLERKRFNSFIEYKWDNDFYTLGFNYDYHFDKISDFGLTDEQKKNNSEMNFVPDDQSISRFHTFYFNIGRLNFKNYLIDGNKLSLKTGLVSISNDNSQVLNSSELKFQYYKLFDNNKNFAWQFYFKNNNLAEIQNLNSLGGFGEVRGYMDGQFLNNSTWHNNFEYRFDLHENKWGVIQGVTFTDQGKDGENINDLLRNKQEVLLSSGFGVRLISPKIYRFVARIDYAQSHTRSIDQGISLGIQQFF